MSSKRSDRLEVRRIVDTAGSVRKSTPQSTIQLAVSKRHVPAGSPRRRWDDPQSAGASAPALADQVRVAHQSVLPS